jgi:hypothetical protein
MNEFLLTKFNFLDIIILSISGFLLTKIYFYRRDIMKRFSRVLALALVLAMTCLLFASCGVSGTYEGILANITFKGNKITLAKGGIQAEGTYKISGDKITIEIEAEGAAIIFKAFEGEHNFEKGKDYVKIGGATYTKAK